MRILHVETINRVAHTYMRGLDRRGHISTVFEPSLAGASRPLPIKLAMMPSRLFDLRRVTSQLTPQHCDITHIHWATYGILGFTSRVPFIVHCHGKDVMPFDAYAKGDELAYHVKPHPLRPVLAQVFRRAAAVLVITPDLLTPARAIHADVVFFPGPVDTDTFSPLAESVPRPFTVLLFSRLHPTKGCEMAMEAMVRFGTRHPEACLQAIKFGPLTQTLELRYGRHVHFLPRIPQEHIQDVVRQADVVVGQFVLGAIGLSESQAMSCAKPVIASFTYQDAYPTPPPVCHATSVSQIEAHLERLYLDREEASALGRQGREWVIAHHGTDVLAERLETIYAAAIESHAKRLRDRRS